MHNAHCFGDGHQSLKKILSKVSSQGWLMGANSYGIPMSYVEASVNNCHNCDYGKWKFPRLTQTL
jgi:hypothetical protein